MIEVSEAKLEMIIDGLLDYAGTCEACPLYKSNQCGDGWDCNKILKEWLKSA